MEDALVKKFLALYEKEPLLVSAPGRVNLIGEHTDYNNGFVLPGAVSKRILFAMAKNDTEEIRVHANQYGESFRFPLHSDRSHEKGWINYLVGMTHYIQQNGKKAGGVDVLIDGDIPVGAGMSSSAALTSGYGFGMNELFHLGMSRMDLAFAGQKTEHHFVGVQCGIMDQFASLHGKKNHVVKLDCRSLEFEYIPFQFPAYFVVLVNTMVSHSLEGSEYNVRRQQCEEGITLLKKKFPQITSLRDVSAEMLEKNRADLPPLVFKRCHFIIHEIQRLLAGCSMLKAGNLEAFGELMYATHEGLSKEYEVSCPESDFLVEITKKMKSVAGARQMGGGFGGCTINLVRADGLEQFGNDIQAAYKSTWGIIPEIYITQLENGVGLI